jgi:hypothetical protein
MSVLETVREMFKELFRGPRPPVALQPPHYVVKPKPAPPPATWMSQDIDAGLIDAMEEADNRLGLQTVQALLLLELVQWQRLHHRPFQ